MRSALDALKWLRAYMHLEPGDEVVWWAVTKHYAWNWLVGGSVLWFLVTLGLRLGAQRLWP